VLFPISDAAEHHFHPLSQPGHAQQGSAWKGQLELRGFSAGKYRVFDYENAKDLGMVDAQSPRIETEFVTRLLLEVRRI